MYVQEVETRMVARIKGLEQEESRMQEWLGCLRKLDDVAARWQMKPIEASAMATDPTQIREPAQDVAFVSRFEPDQESSEPLHEHCSADGKPPQIDNDPFDELRRKLTGEPGNKPKPVFNSGPLFGANA